MCSARCFMLAAVIVVALAAQGCKREPKPPEPKTESSSSLKRPLTPPGGGTPGAITLTAGPGGNPEAGKPARAATARPSNGTGSGTREPNEHTAALDPASKAGTVFYLWLRSAR